MVETLAMLRLYTYIIREHIGPIVFAITAATVVLIVDLIPDVVAMSITKGLPVTVAIRIFVLSLASIFALAVPLAFLAGTLMAFGRMASDAEVGAMMATGISLYRVISPVFVMATVAATSMVMFNNTVLPEANHQIRKLTIDISRKRPTLELRAGVLEDQISGYHLFFASLDDKSSDITGITILDHKNSPVLRTVTAKTGKMRYSDDGNTLILELHDGEIHEPDLTELSRYRRTRFEHQVFYLTDMGSELTNRDVKSRGDREKSSAELQADISSWEASIAASRWATALVCSAWVSAIFLHTPDSQIAYYPMPLSRASFLPAQGDAIASRRAMERVNLILEMMDRGAVATEQRRRLIDRHKVEIHKKLAIPASCMVFVLIGCPLAVRLRRRGAGAAIGVSLCIYLVFWAILICGENLADRSTLAPWCAMWSADLLLGGVGLFMLWASTNEVELTPWALSRWLSNRLKGKK